MIFSQHVVYEPSISGLSSMGIATQSPLGIADVINDIVANVVSIKGDLSLQLFFLLLLLLLLSPLNSLKTVLDCYI